MSEMIDKVFSTKLAEQMTGFYGKQKMLRKLNNKLEMNNQQQKVVELDDLVKSYSDRVTMSEEGLYDDCEPGVDCGIMADEHVLDRMEDILAEAYMAQDEQGEYDAWTGTRDFLEFGEAREDSYLEEYEQDELYRQLEDELAYKERELALAKRTAEREKMRREKAEEGHYHHSSDFNGQLPSPQPQPQPKQHQTKPQPKAQHPKPQPQPQPQPKDRSSHPVPSISRHPQVHHQQTKQQVQEPQKQLNESDFDQESLYFDAYEKPGSSHFDLEYEEYYSGPQHQHHHMDPSEAAEFSHRKAASWEDQYEAMNREAAKRQREERQASYEADLWEHEQADLHAEMHAAQEAEAEAARLAKKWSNERLEIEKQLRRTKEAEMAAQKEAHIWHQSEDVMDQAATDLNKFELYTESLRKKNWDELRTERENRRTRERNLFPPKKSPNLAAPASTPSPQWESAGGQPAMPTSSPAATKQAADSLPMENDEYGTWTDPPFTPHHHHDSPHKKSVAMRWLDPDWSLIRWVKSMFTDEEPEETDASGHPIPKHDHDGRHYDEPTKHPHQNGLNSNEFQQDNRELPIELPEIGHKQPAHAIIISSIFSVLVTLFGLYICMKVILPKNRFERNSNLTVFYLAAFSFLIVSVIPVTSNDSEVVYHFHKKWDNHPTSALGVCTEIFRLSVIMFHLSSITNLFLLNVNRKFKDVEQLAKWATFGAEFNIVGTFVCLAFLIPLRQDFDWMYSLPLPYIVAAIFILAMRPDSRLEIALNLVILILAYLQFTNLFILAVFILNFKVFQFGYRKTKYVKTSKDASIAWAKSEFQEATSYLNSTLEMTTDGDGIVADHSIKRDIRSYGIISVKEEKIEYIGSSSDASFVLFDASGPSDDRSEPMVTGGPPPIHKSELDLPSKKNGNTNGTIVSDHTNPRRHKEQQLLKQNNNIFNSTQIPVTNQTFSSQQSSTVGGAVAANNTVTVPLRSNDRGGQQPMQTTTAAETYQPPNLLPPQSNNTYQMDPHLLQHQGSGSSFAATQKMHHQQQQQRPAETHNQLFSNSNQGRASAGQQQQRRQNNHLPSGDHSTRSGFLIGDESRYHSQLDEFRSNAHTDNNVGDEDLFYDCTGRSTPNLGMTSCSDTSGILLQMPTTPTRGQATTAAAMQQRQGNYNNQQSELMHDQNNLTLNFQSR